MRTRITPVIAALFIGQGVWAQTAAPPSPPAEPATKIEAFSAKTGIVIIKGYSTVSRIYGQGEVKVDAREVRDASNPGLAVYGLEIEVKESGRLERVSRSFIDLDEVDSLVRGLDYISKVTSAVTPLKNFEAQYRTKDDLAVTVYTGPAGQLSLAVESGRVVRVSAFFDLVNLERLKNHIVEAKRILESARASK